MCIKSSLKWEGKKKYKYAVTPDFRLWVVECLCLLAFKPDCIVFNGGKFHAKNAKIFAKGAKTFNDETIGTIGAIDCSFENYNLLMRSSETSHYCCKL